MLRLSCALRQVMLIERVPIRRLNSAKLLVMDANPVFDRITVEPGKCGGKPCIRGMRITVRRVLEILATYRERDDLFREYPFLEEEDLRQALRYGAASVDDDVHYLHEVA